MNIDPGSTIYRTLCLILMCVACSQVFDGINYKCSTPDLGRTSSKQLLFKLLAQIYTNGTHKQSHLSFICYRCPSSQSTHAQHYTCYSCGILMQLQRSQAFMSCENNVLLHEFVFWARGLVVQINGNCLTLSVWDLKN